VLLGPVEFDADIDKWDYHEAKDTKVQMQEVLIVVQ
jgi:hypothetical protein